jgi:hypothetical protein
MFTPRSFRGLRWGATGGVGVLVLAALLAVLGGRAAEGRVAAVPTAAAVAGPVESGPVETSVPVPTTAPTASTAVPAPATTTAVARVVVPTTVAVVRTTVAPPVVREAAAAAPVADAVAAPAPAAPSTSTAERCAAARQWVDGHGLVLPAGYGFRCPGSAMQGETSRWGITCWNCAGAGSYIAVDIDRIGPSDATLRYVVAHETCHAIDFATLGISTEIGADLCAALHGAPRP